MSKDATSKDATNKDAEQNGQVSPQDNEKLIKEMEKVLEQRAQFLIANDPQCCQLRGALDYASGKYQLRDDEQPANGAGE